MKKKKFIKEMRAARFPRDIIKQACDAVKELGGALSYEEFKIIFSFKLRIYATFNLPCKFVIKDIKKSCINGALKKFYRFPRGNIRVHGLRADLVTIDENSIFSIDTADNPDETAREMWSKKNPYINHKAESEVKE